MKTTGCDWLARSRTKRARQDFGRETSPAWCLPVSRCLFLSWPCSFLVTPPVSSFPPSLLYLLLSLLHLNPLHFALPATRLSFALRSSTAAVASRSFAPTHVHSFRTHLVNC